MNEEKEDEEEIEKFTSSDKINRLLAESFKKHDLAYFFLSKL